MPEQQLYIARINLRVVNQLIDLLVIFVLWLIIITTIIYFGNYNLRGDEEIPFLYFLILPIFWSYYLIFEFLTQKTIGKFFTRTKVVTNKGGRPTFSHILVRTFSRSIPFEYLAYFFNTNGLHDRISKTIVIKC